MAVKLIVKISKGDPAWEEQKSSYLKEGYMIETDTPEFLEMGKEQTLSEEKVLID